MAYSGQEQVLRTFTAGADLSSSQFRFVELGANGVTVANAATDKPIGVLQNRPTNGEDATVCVFGPTRVSADGAIALAASIGTSADGQADSKAPGTDTNDYLLGVALEAATAANQLISAFVNCINPARGA